MTVDTGDLQGMVLGNIAGYRLVRHLIFSAPDAASLRRFVNEIRPFILFGTNKPTAAHGWVANISFAAGTPAAMNSRTARSAERCLASDGLSNRFA